MDIELARDQMLGQQVRAWEVLDERVLGALRSVPREEFVPPGYRALAFADVAVPIGFGEEMLAPKIEGRMLQALGLGPHDRVLEVGAGSGFTAACLGRIAGDVLSIDIRDDFVTTAQARLAACGAANVRLQTADVFTFRPVDRFDAIAVTGSLPVFDERFVAWLNPGGRLFCIVGEEPIMEAMLVTRRTGDEWTGESLFETVVPALRNAQQPPRFRF